ncbi:hypothetical protein CC78DRAFT_184850 [Lojkania enalia]|uniref:Uncharacterized protein n=1 Tax=Lojkania enalia TaxID=147567 RepID=A0A9P4JVL1_9PLEO|nr:hypothetical protein CC78DRAFT_184850 [Didymosphaeria enalia]
MGRVYHSMAKAPSSCMRDCKTDSTGTIPRRCLSVRRACPDLSGSSSSSPTPPRHVFIGRPASRWRQWLPCEARIGVVASPTLTSPPLVSVHVACSFAVDRQSFTTSLEGGEAAKSWRRCPPLKYLLPPGVTLTRKSLA